MIKCERLEDISVGKGVGSRVSVFCWWECDVVARRCGEELKGLLFRRSVYVNIEDGFVVLLVGGVKYLGNVRLGEGRIVVIISELVFRSLYGDV